jgi:hypothetical protein
MFEQYESGEESDGYRILVGKPERKILLLR